MNETEATRSELGYTNALRLTGSLLYLKTRVYDAEARVFVQPDTVDRLRYAYVTGDPANLNDPTGLAEAQDAPSLFYPMNPVQQFIMEAMAFWDRDSWFTEVQPKTKTNEQQTKKESEKQQPNEVALQNDQQETDTEAQEVSSLAKGPGPSEKDAKSSVTTSAGPFETKNQAARAALKSINKKSIQEDKEYAGFIFKKGDKEYVYTKPVKLGEAGGSLAVPTDVNGELVGVYHSHGAKNPAYRWTNFSQTDMDTARQLSKGKANVIMYLIRPDWVIRQYDPSKPEGHRVSPVPVEDRAP